jgi:hypothetical protein
VPNELDRMVDEDDRRGNESGRDRISAIAKRFAQIARDLDRRYRRISHWLIGSMVTFAIFFALGALALTEVWGEQKVIRYQAVYSACLERNRTNSGIVSYLSDLGASDKELTRARTRFPTEPDCQTYTTLLFDDDEAPEGAFDLPAELDDAEPTPTPTP